MALPRKIHTIIEDVRRIDNKIICLDLKPGKRVPNFKPGQFLHLSLFKYKPSSEWPESRVFSIASAPGIRNNRVSVVISKQGSYTNRIYNECKIGKEIWIKLPYGDFSLHDCINNYVLIAGGTGISPYLSMIENFLINDVKKNIFLYYGIQKEQHFLGKDLLKKYEEANPQFKKQIFVQEKNLNYRTGLININDVIAETKDLNAFYYISGPKIMITKFKNSLIKNSIDIERIIVDEWD